MRNPSLVCAFGSLAAMAPLKAVPPLVSGDVPTADKETFEWYVGTRYQSEGGSVSRQVPVTELVYGLSDRQEVTFETAFLSQQDSQGFGDIVLGSKYLFLKEADSLPGISGTFEIKLPSAGRKGGLGTGAYDYDLRVPVEKTWGWFTLLGNVGYTVVGEPRIGGIREPRRNVWFVSSAQEYQITPRTKLLDEVYLETGDRPGTASRFAADVGFEHKLRENFKVHATVGKSLRGDNRGGPGLRVYAGFEWDFDAPWKTPAR